ncbi:geranylgeranyl diphosphate synthase type I [Streptosporangium becharense]|uniref:Geranylgeranyl diphosphate synthase type I n=1 Tax=Streptosporangium becharense TaxID=1816182 RepID=A0A7W9MJU6_9ACTN|nr:polyprenyl synthetase family protein [Streptosporangium becharense]MBB2910318.1 geranylgeranyl diphosphate synthase type I [Streptosporangium becharense]MBB5823061.1 geranylgeranyl diphosphate synthase type I [Streptosporangium becharense]
MTSAAQVLAEAEALVRPALRRTIVKLPERERRVAEYHFGWADGSAADEATSGNGGKALRSALVLGAARAVGGDARRAVPGAVAVELVHNFSLLHDDVMDADRMRRHRPAAWVRFGVGAAVLAGDALQILSLQVLTGTGDPALTDVLIDTMADLMRGQSDDLAFESRDDVTAAEYRSMAELKTGALLGGACMLGALLGGSSPERARELGRFGRHLGVAFQCADDILGIWGRADRTGKPVGADVAARKKTLPVITALADASEAGRRLAALYRRPEPPGREECASMTALIEAAGGRAAVEAEGRRQITLALACLDRAEPQKTARADLATIAEWAMHRDR